MSTVDATVHTGDTVTAGRPRRWVRRVVVALVVLLALVLVATVGIGYYFSSVLLTVDTSTSYPVEVKSVNGSEVVLSDDADTERPAILGLAWEGGRAVLDTTVRRQGGDVVRTVTTVHGILTAGLHAAIDTRVYAGDPRATRGLDFQDVVVSGELGDLPAWYMPPTGGGRTARTWVIAVHGLGADRTEALRALPIIAAAGLPTLAVSYRNDPGAPASPDNRYHLGDTEWRDVGAAITYARAHGASGVVLYAWSMGGAVSMTALRRLPAADATFIKGLVLDSANIDWNAILDYQGSQRGLPGFVTWTAKRFVEWRGGLDLGDFDQRPYAPSLRVPVLMFVDSADRTVPNGPAVDFAAARPDLVTLVRTSGGGHTGSWNAGPDAYAAKVGAFLTTFD